MCSDAMAISMNGDLSCIAAGGGGSNSDNINNVTPIRALAVYIVLAMSGLILFVFRTPLRVWLHSKYGVRVFDPCKGGSKGKIYNAFISYSTQDD